MVASTNDFMKYVSTEKPKSKYDYRTDMARLLRKQKFAEDWRNKGMMPNKAGNMVDGWYVPTANTQHLAKIAELGTGIYGGHLASKEASLIAKTLKQEAKDQYATGMGNPNLEERMRLSQEMSMEGNPYSEGAAKSMFDDASRRQVLQDKRDYEQGLMSDIYGSQGGATAGPGVGGGGGGGGGGSSNLPPAADPRLALLSPGLLAAEQSRRNQGWRNDQAITAAETTRDNPSYSQQQSSFGKYQETRNKLEEVRASYVQEHQTAVLKHAELMLTWPESLSPPPAPVQPQMPDSLPQMTFEEYLGSPFYQRMNAPPNPGAQVPTPRPMSMPPAAPMPQAMPRQQNASMPTQAMTPQVMPQGPGGPQPQAAQIPQLLQQQAQMPPQQPVQPQYQQGPEPGRSAVYAADTAARMDERPFNDAMRRSREAGPMPTGWQDPDILSTRRASELMFNERNPYQNEGDFGFGGPAQVAPAKIPPQPEVQELGPQSNATPTTRALKSPVPESYWHQYAAVGDRIPGTSDLNQAQRGQLEYEKEKGLRTAATKRMEEIHDKRSKTDEMLGLHTNALQRLQEYEGLGGTGFWATLNGAKATWDPELQQLRADFNKIKLKELVAMFSGMSKAVDSNAERRAFESQAVDIGLDEKVNTTILIGGISALTKAKGEADAQQQWIEKTGSMDGYQSPIFGKQTAMFSREGEPILVEKSKVAEMKKQGYMGADDYVRLVNRGQGGASPKSGAEQERREFEDLKRELGIE